ncbi:hypothetical protein [Methylobacterium sp. sgz302541]|uniref:hypothetical protein n=1 Tax=unclassified Methylobacterium TaxID=2615210 RepID=UPI003D331C15
MTPQTRRLSVMLMLCLPATAQARTAETGREVALALVRLVHLQKVCPAFLAIDQGLASTMARNLLVKGYEEFGADAFEKTVETVSDEFRRSLAPNRDADWCADEREFYRRKNRDGLFR